MNITRLTNGLTVIIEQRPTKSVTIEVMVKTGSNNETLTQQGISHFVEHMLFEGTKKRTARQIANEIEKKGGDVNAYTGNEQTAFFVSVLKKHFDIALDVLSDIIINPLFETASIEKEKKVILEEIKLTTDQPRYYQWVLFTSTLFKNHPAKNPVYGTQEIVKKLQKKDLTLYYQEHYVPKNMIISIVGNVTGALSKVRKQFEDLKPGTIPKGISVIEPDNKFSKKVIFKKTLQSYLILGYKTVGRLHKDSYCLDVIRAILGRGQSGRLFEEIRQKRGLAYEVGVNNEVHKDYGFFAVYLNTHKKNLVKCTDLILKEFKNLDKITNKHIKEAKDFIEGEFHLRHEDNFRRADQLAFFETTKSANLAKSYIKKIMAVKQSDVKRVAKKYLNKKYVTTIIKQS